MTSRKTQALTEKCLTQDNFHVAQYLARDWFKVVLPSTEKGD